MCMCQSETPLARYTIALHRQMIPFWNQDDLCMHNLPFKLNSDPLWVAIGNLYSQLCFVYLYFVQLSGHSPKLQKIKSMLLKCGGLEEWAKYGGNNSRQMNKCATF